MLKQARIAAALIRHHGLLKWIIGAAALVSAAPVAAAVVFVIHACIKGAAA